jgi:hypothetical protein
MGDKRGDGGGEDEVDVHEVSREWSSGTTWALAMRDL